MKRSRRAIQAEATRKEIVAAARVLFARQGYAATSMVEIADKAGVALQTLYSSVGTKSEILLAMDDLIDEESGLHESVAARRMIADPVDRLKAYVHLTRTMSERCGDIIWTLIAAAPSEPDVAEAVRVGFSRHEIGARMMADALAESGSLRSDVPVKQAGDILALMTWHENYRRLISDFNWTLDEVEAWLNSTLAQLLLEPEEV